MEMVEQISVVLACFNGERTINNCLVSINNQDMPLELVFINDGSTDNTLIIVNNFKFNKNISLKIVSRENKGFLYSLDEGIKLSAGDYIARIDADDFWCDNHLKLVMKEFSLDRNLVLVGSSASKIDGVNKQLGIYGVPNDHNDIVKYLHKDSPFIHSSVVFKKKEYLKTPGYLIGNDEKSMISSDYNLWFELSKLGNCKNIQDSTLYYTVTNESMSRKLNKYINYSARYSVMKKVNKYYRKYPIYFFFQRIKIFLRIAEYYLRGKIN